MPTTPLSFAFCESCSPNTRFCKTYHVRGPQTRIVPYYKGVPRPWYFGIRTRTEGGFIPGQCIVCTRSTSTRIQRGKIHIRRGEYQEYCCPRCHYQNKLEVLVGRDEESSDPEEESDEFSERKSEDSEDSYDRRYWHRDGLGCWCGPTTHQPIELGSANSPCESTWKQTKEEIEINVPLEDRARARDIVCQITSTTLKLCFRCQEQQITHMLWEKCDADQSGWQIISREVVRHGECTKATARCIQVTIIKSSRPIGCTSSKGRCVLPKSD